MAAPEFVIATAPFKKYPGGIIVVPAVSWLGASRGTLTTETDARSVYGTVVRDTQKVSAHLQSFAGGFGTAAYAEAVDTLVIDLSTIPLESQIQRYIVLASILIEGDWQASDASQSYGSTQEVFWNACTLAWKYVNQTSSGPFYPNNQPRGLDNYRIIGYGGNWSLEKPNFNSWSNYSPMTWKAYSRAGSTIEYLIDQIYFIPAQFQSSAFGRTWTNDDFRIIPGDITGYSYLDFSTGEFIDGADGGDANGKFTLHPGVWDPQTDISGQDGGGDYQKSDNEYSARVRATEFDGDYQYLSDSTRTFPDNEPRASHMYGIHGSFYVPSQVWIDDPFSRTDGDNNFGSYGDAENHFSSHDWGHTPEGFRWYSGAPGGIGPYDYTNGDPPHRHGVAVFTDGSAGGITIRTADGWTVTCALGSLVSEPNGGGAYIQSDNIRMRLKFWYTDSSLAEHYDGDSGPGYGGQTSIYTATNGLEIRFDFSAKTWELWNNAGYSIHGPVDISSWWNFDAQVGVHIEIRRYLLQVKVWDAGGAEPGAFDYDDFRPLYRSGPGTKVYPYQTAGIDDLDYAFQEAWDICRPEVRVSAGNHRYNGCQTVYFDDVVIDHDPGGENKSAWALVERPEGTEIGRIEIPPGCQHLVYWGTRDWTTFIPGDWSYIDFSAKVWNDAAAAELQRSEIVWWWFRSIHGLTGLLAMNWHHGSPTNKIMLRP